MYTCSPLDYMFKNVKWESLVLSTAWNPVGSTRNQCQFRFRKPVGETADVLNFVIQPWKAGLENVQQKHALLDRNNNILSLVK